MGLLLKQIIAGQEDSGNAGIRRPPVAQVKNFPDFIRKAGILCSSIRAM